MNFIYEVKNWAQGVAVGDWAQIGLAALTGGTLILLYRQLVLQNRILRAQLLRDRFEMYWRTYEPISDDDVKMVHLNPQDYMPIDEYERYKQDDSTIKKFVLMSKLVEYLAFTHILRRLGIKDLLGADWLVLWTKSLKSNPEFLIMKNYYQQYYPEFSDFVDKLK